jgi:hypothetical protein
MLRRFASGEVVEHDRHGDAGAAETRRPVHDLGIGGDVRSLVHDGHLRRGRSK